MKIQNKRDCLLAKKNCFLLEKIDLVQTTFLSLMVRSVRYKPPPLKK